ncbi:methyl farnesoate epoxidase [Copidosoma floridanum]|uniref:methyl farnesoate epoxidase n=1 Tax=Copidosoma floridanum TaxID=29053 RepID=UPI0006C9569F|nr:methyl farnesoate epoxidase [Copidosoma floridanum]
MVSVELGLLLVAIVLATIGFKLQKSRYRRLPPGPYQWPFVGNVKLLRGLSQKLGGQHEALLELSRRYGSPVLRLKLGGRSDTIVVSGIECIHAVLSSEDYDGRPWNYFVQLRNMGKKKGITMNDGPDWREIRGWFVRSMRSVGFAKREMSDFIKHELTEVLQNIGDGGVRRIKPVIVPAIINVLWTFATGNRFDEERLKHFTNLMDRRAQAFDMSGGVLAAYPWLRYIAPEWSGYNLLVTVNSEFKAILMETIDSHKKNHVLGSEADLIDMFLNEMYGGKGPEAGFDDDQLVIILLDVLLAGLNITALTLEFLFLNMLINRDAQRKLHEEIDRVIGRDKLPDLNDRPKMAYAEAVILESQRLVPVVPVIGPRRVLRDTVLLGYDVPRETVVLINLHSINHDPGLYPEPRAFRPERFLDNGLRRKDDNLLFFGKGKRQCPGVSLAKSAVFLIFVGIMQRYELVPVPGQEPPSLQVKPGMTMSAKPFDVLLVPRTLD